MTDKEQYICPHCDIDFPSQTKLTSHTDTFHQAAESSEASHDFELENLQCPAKCEHCNQIIWEVAFMCSQCRARCHRSCSERLSRACKTLDIPSHKHKRKEHPGTARNISDFFRRKVGENKMRYVDEKYDLDLSYISNRIIAMSFPASGVEAVYRNKMAEVAELLDTKHKDNYMIINVSDRTYDTSVFKNQVLDFGWPDHHAPLMNMLCCIVKTMDGWLREDPNHVIVCHCKGGKGRTGVAIAAYIQYSNMCLSAEDCLDKFAMNRFYDETIGGVTQPSQRRMVHYFSSLMRNEVKLENKQLLLDTIILFGAPNFDSKGGAKICFCVYEQFKPVFTTKVYGVTPDREHVYISVGNIKVSSDVMIKAYHISKTGKTCVLRVQFHTAFVNSNHSCVFRKKDMDIACRDDRFPSDGVLQLVFKPKTSEVTKDTDSVAHHALVNDLKEAVELEDLTRDAQLISFDDYTDFSGFYTDNPLSETKQNELLDSILSLKDDKTNKGPLLSPLHPLPFTKQPPPPLPAKRGSHTLPRDHAPRDVPPLPPRKGKLPDPLNTPLETTPPVSKLVKRFESVELIDTTMFNNWVTFDEDSLIDLSTPELPPKNQPSDDPPLRPKHPPLVTHRSGSPTAAAKHPALSSTRSESEPSFAADDRKVRSLDRRVKDTTSPTDSNKRNSSYVPFAERKESFKKDQSGKVRYVPYKVRQDSLNRQSSSESRSSECPFSPPPASPLVKSPPPLPPREDTLPKREVPTPPLPTASTTEDTPLTRTTRLSSFSRSLDNILSFDQVPSPTSLPRLTSESPDEQSLEYSLINWEKATLRKVIKSTKHIWFQPDISRQESQATLVSQTPGSFIIRKSQTQAGCYGITVRLEDGKKLTDFILHPGSHKVSSFLIQKNSKGLWYINGYDHADFSCLEDLVEFYTGHTGGLPHPLKVPIEPYTDRVEDVIPILLKKLSFPVFILERKCIRYLPLNSFAEDNVKSLLTETISQITASDIRLISMSVTKQGLILTDPACKDFDQYNISYKQIRNCEVGGKTQTISLPSNYQRNSKTAQTFGLIHRDGDGEIVYVALAEYEDSGLSITKTINKFRSYLV